MRASRSTSVWPARPVACGRAAMLAPVLACFVGAAAPASAGERAMLLPVDGPGLPPPMRDEIDGTLREAVRAAGLEVESAEATAELISDAYAGGLTCNFSDPACAARFGSIADVPVVLVAAVAGKPMVLRLARVDVGRARVVEQAAARFTLPDRAGALRALAATMAHPPATLEIQVTPAGAIVSVDGVDVGRAPLPPLAIATGTHRVRAHLEGFVDDDKAIALAPGDHAPVALRLEKPPATVAAVTTPAPEPRAPAPERPPPPPHPGGPMLAAGASTLIAGALLGAACGVGAIVVEDDLAAPKVGGHDPSERSLGLGLVGGALLGGVGAAAGATLVGLALVE